MKFIVLEEDKIIVEHDPTVKISSFIDVIDMYILETGNKVSGLMVKMDPNEFKEIPKNPNKCYVGFKPQSKEKIIINL